MRLKMLNSVVQGDCLNVMRSIPNNYVNLILCDLPYSTTDCYWDKLIPFPSLWEQYKRILVDNGTVLLFAQKKFVAGVISSNYDYWRYRWIWKKDKSANFMCAKFQPLAFTEEIHVFNQYGFTKSWNDPNHGNKGIYNIQWLPGDGKTRRKGQTAKTSKNMQEIRKRTKHDDHKILADTEKRRYPQDVLFFNTAFKKRIHPTQKPVSLLEVLIKTYTHEKMIVLDNCAGSGSTAIACIKTNRKFIMIEQDSNYVDICKERINEYKQNSIDLYENHQNKEKTQDGN